MAEAQESTLFKVEYELELERWLRRRYGFFLACTIALNVLVVLFGSLMLALWPEGVSSDPSQAPSPGTGWRDTVISLLGAALVLVIAARAYTVERPRLQTRQQTLRSASWFIMMVGVIYLTRDTALRVWADASDLQTTLGSLSELFTLHVLACLFLPWTARESLRPMYPLAGLFLVQLAVLLLAGVLDAGSVVMGILMLPLALAPGCVVCWLRLWRRRRQFNREMYAKGFFAMRRELNQARAVQLALFPKPIRSPEIEFDFSYIPANDVGGDFIHASIDAKGRLDVVVVDVTGHGLASALTVARLSGEIERLLAENPDISPGHVLRMLNRYVNLTLSRHSVYATAICLQVYPDTGRVEYANAGHPPAFLRRANGSVERFDSTTWLLGAAPDSMFEANQVEFVMGPQDTLVLVTDGVHEAPSRHGDRFGLERLQGVLSGNPPPERWCQHVATVVEEWRRGLGDDDLLVATIRVGQAVPALPPPRPRAADIDADTQLGMSPFAPSLQTSPSDLRA